MTTFDIHQAALSAAQNLSERVDQIHQAQLLCLTGAQALAKAQAQAAEVESKLSTEVAFNSEFKNDTQRKAALVQLRANNPDLQNLKDEIAAQEAEIAVSRLDVEKLKRADQADQAVVSLSVALLGSV